MPRLVYKGGPHQGETFALDKARIVIGRDMGCDVQLLDGKTSRKHAEITVDRGQHFIVDLGSANGTMLNGRNVRKGPLVNGDEIMIGNTTLRFEDEETHRQEEAVGGAEEFQTIRDTAALALTRRTFAGEGGADMERARAGLVTLYELSQAANKAKTLEDLFEAVTGELRESLQADRVYPILLEERGGARTSESDPEAKTDVHEAMQPDEAAAPSGKKSKSGRKPGGAAADSARAPEQERPTASGPAAAKVRWRFWQPERARFTVDLVRAPISKTVVEHVRVNGVSVLWNLKESAEMREAASVSRHEILSAVCVPLNAGGRVLGVLYADRLKGGSVFERSDLELLTAAAAQVAAAIDNIRRLDTLDKERKHLEHELRGQYSILGESAAMAAVYTFIERAAPADGAVLILGESGTGKELVARAIHYNSRRKSAPFEVLNCAALSETLIESELFGHVKGAFTGAHADRPGRFELADGGAIFLDEIGELPAASQTKLLRALEQGETARVGEARVRTVDVRVIAATNRDLEKEAADGRFRKDLYYRLNVLSLRLPPLRDRGEDVALLARYFLRTYSDKAGRRGMSLSPEAEAALRRHTWPGNVREIKNLMERLVVMAPKETVVMADLPPEIASGRRGAAEGKSGSPASWKLADVEKAHILSVLESVNGNKKQAAEMLGIDRSTLYAKLKAYGMTVMDSGVMRKE
jgi:transcriptional regulator with GAF, ATPase, and Fis domain